MNATQGSVRIPDGRHLGFAEYGPPVGHPIVFVPGAGCGRMMSFPAADHRLISVDRPGLGASSPHAQKTVPSVGADIATLIDRVIGHPVPVVANSQGAPFGLAVAAAGAASVLVLVSPIDEMAHPSVAARLPDAYRALLRDVAADPDAAAASFARYRAEDVFEMVMSDYPDCDAAVYDRADFRAEFRAALDDGFRSGSDGYARDTVLAMSPWPAESFTPQVEVTVLYGAADRNHSPDLAESLTSRISGATRHVVADAGGALLWTHPDLVVALT